MHKKIQLLALSLLSIALFQPTVSMQYVNEAKAKITEHHPLHTLAFTIATISAIKGLTYSSDAIQQGINNIGGISGVVSASLTAGAGAIVGVYGGEYALNMLQRALFNKPEQEAYMALDPANEAVKIAKTRDVTWSLGERTLAGFICAPAAVGCMWALVAGSNSGGIISGKATRYGLTALGHLTVGVFNSLKARVS